MKFRLREIIVDEMLVLAAVSASLMAAGRALQLSRFNFVVAAAFMFLLFTTNFWWDLRGEAYKKLSGFVRAAMVLIVVARGVSVLSARSSSASVHDLLRTLLYFVLITLVALSVLEVIRQAREKQTLRSVKENGTV